jgi:hypothetical protein
MNFSEILTIVRQRIKKLPESPFLHTYIYIQAVSEICVLVLASGRTRQIMELSFITFLRKSTKN